MFRTWIRLVPDFIIEVDGVVGAATLRLHGYMQGFSCEQLAFSYICSDIVHLFYTHDYAATSCNECVGVNVRGYFGFVVITLS